MESGKIVFFLVLVLIAIMFGIGYDEVSSKANFKQEKGVIFHDNTQENLIKLKLIL